MNTIINELIENIKKIEKKTPKILNYKSFLLAIKNQDVKKFKLAVGNIDPDDKKDYMELYQDITSENVLNQTAKKLFDNEITGIMTKEDYESASSHLVDLALENNIGLKLYEKLIDKKEYEFLEDEVIPKYLPEEKEFVNLIRAEKGKRVEREWGLPSFVIPPPESFFPFMKIIAGKYVERRKGYKFISSYADVIRFITDNNLYNLEKFYLERVEEKTRGYLGDLLLLILEYEEKFPDIILPTIIDPKSEESIKYKKITRKKYFLRGLIKKHFEMNKYDPKMYKLWEYIEYEPFIALMEIWNVKHNIFKRYIKMFCEKNKRYLADIQKELLKNKENYPLYMSIYVYAKKTRKETSTLGWTYDPKIIIDYTEKLLGKNPLEKKLTEDEYLFLVKLWKYET
jgi:hypothetical protein